MSGTAKSKSQDARLNVKFRKLGVDHDGTKDPKGKPAGNSRTDKAAGKVLAPTKLMAESVLEHLWTELADKKCGH